MFTRLRIQNFKAWKDTGDIRLAPLTVFFGTNSSGKSSLLQFLLMLKQTVQSTDRKRVLHFGDRYSLVDLGTFPEMVFNQDPKADFKFEVEWEPLPEAMEETFWNISPDWKRITFEADIGRESEQSERLVVKRLEYRLGPRIKATRVGARRRPDGSGYEFTQANIRPTGMFNWVNAPTPTRFYGLSLPLIFDVPHAEGGEREELVALEDLVHAFEQQLDGLHHLGPWRHGPMRSYPWSGESPEHVGPDGELAVSALLASQDRRIIAGADHSEHAFTTLIAEWLQRLGLLESSKSFADGGVSGTSVRKRSSRRASSWSSSSPSGAGRNTRRSSAGDGRRLLQVPAHPAPRMARLRSRAPGQGALAAGSP